jgi:N-glycosylase/DNA lyase
MIILHAPDLHLTATLDCGQTFGYTKNSDGSFGGYLSGVPVRFLHAEGLLRGECAPGRLEAGVVREYFDLEYDLGPVYRMLQVDDLLRPSLSAYRGLRLLRQDPWEATAGFIISANNNIKRIQLIWKRVAEHFTGVGRFPSAQELARASESDLRKLGLGYRAPFLYKTARTIAENPGQFLAWGGDADYVRAKHQLMTLDGVGPKVADCILLYGFHRLEAFPIDVWILRVMKKLYYRNRSKPAAQIHRFALKRWGAHAGYIQQYLFHAVRTGVIQA